MQIAIDGPAGAGKSTVAKMAAKELGFVYIDTGAMYRALGVSLSDAGINIEDTGALSAALENLTMDLAYENDVQQVIVNGVNLTGRIRTPEAGDMASKVSAIAMVRKKLVAIQQALAARLDVIMDGRDIGTVVLKDAELKIYFTADTEVRALRRCAELESKGIHSLPEDVGAEIAARDYRDTHRAASPLMKAEGAVVIDSSYLSIAEGVAMVKALILARKGEAG